MSVEEEEGSLDSSNTNSSVDSNIPCASSRIFHCSVHCCLLAMPK